MTNNGLRTVLHSWATPEVNRQQRAAAELNPTSGENAQAQWWSITLLLRRGGRVNSSHITRPHLPTQHSHEYVFTLFNWLFFLFRGSTQLCCHFSYRLNARFLWITYERFLLKGCDICSLFYNVVRQDEITLYFELKLTLFFVHLLCTNLLVCLTTLCLWV